MVLLYVGFTSGLVVNNPPVKQETQVWCLCWEIPLEKEMTTHSNIFAWKTAWMEEPGGIWSMRLKKFGHDLATKEQLATITIMQEIKSDSFT